MKGLFSLFFGKRDHNLSLVEQKTTQLLDTIKDQNDIMKMKEKNLNDLLQALQREQEKNREIQDNLVVLLQAVQLNKIRKYKMQKVEDAVKGVLSDEEKIIRFLEEKGNASTKQVVEILGLRRETVSRKLNEIVEKGLLVREGSGKNTTYRLSR